MSYDVHQRLLELARGFTAAAIGETLKKEFGWTPHRNTIYKEIARHAPHEVPWSLADTSFSADEARAVLEELAYVWAASGGAVDSVSPRQAWWIARLKAIRPDAPPGVAFALAQSNAWDENAGFALGSLDDDPAYCSVAFRPAAGAGKPWSLTLSRQLPPIDVSPPDRDEESTP